MTNAIEQSKREMYQSFENLKNYAGAKVLLDEFESFLETHLELLRQDLSALHETARKRFEDIQSLEAVNAELQTSLENLKTYNSRQAVTIGSADEEIADLEGRLAKAVEERDLLRNRQQASDHAQGAIQEKGANVHQSSAENSSSAALDGKTAAIIGAVFDARQIVSDWAVYGYSAKKQMKKLAYAINNNPELHAAILEFEKGDGYGAWFINNTQCMHSFHPAFPGGEQCVFCGVGK